MPVWTDVVRIHKQNPRWSALEIAAELNCHPGYVRATARRRGLTLPSSVKVPSVYAIGRAAQNAGLTLEIIEMVRRSGVIAEFAAIIEGEKNAN